jgi:hypothetical protein
MAQPAAFPSENKEEIVKELKAQIDFFSEHLQQAMENPLLQEEESFLKELSENIQTLDKLTKSMKFKDLSINVKETVDEVVSILSPILHLSLGLHQEQTLIEASKNYTLPSSRESDLCRFLASLEKYPESVRVLIQELALLSEDLRKCL